MEQALAPHLGGYVAGGDPATYYPDLWEFLVTAGDVSSVIDVGCGDGVALRAFADLGCTVLGVDGVPQDDERIVQHDYTTGPFVPDARFDLAWCCEFVEHVVEWYVPNFLATLVCADLILLTHAEPGQCGHHHVNCRTSDYWKGALAAVGYSYDDRTTQVARILASVNRSPWNHFVRSGMAFRRDA